MKHCTCKALISFPSKYNYKIADTWRLWLLIFKQALPTDDWSHSFQFYGFALCKLQSVLIQKVKLSVDFIVRAMRYHCTWTLRTLTLLHTKPSQSTQNLKKLSPCSPAKIEDHLTWTEGGPLLSTTPRVGNDFSPQLGPRIPHLVQILEKLGLLIFYSMNSLWGLLYARLQTMYANLDKKSIYHLSLGVSVLTGKTESTRIGLGIHRMRAIKDIGPAETSPSCECQSRISKGTGSLNGNMKTMWPHKLIIQMKVCTSSRMEEWSCVIITARSEGPSSMMQLTVLISISTSN